ncbi:MAG: hypothetical protein HFE63_00195 [Clostridiales bacterium]|nr:hypothetical protein [Clostridiales bacterium]
MVQKMRFWGTSAGEGTPTPFCECPICEYARKVGGRENRLRSSFRIDEFTAIDLGADFNAAAQKLNESLFSIENILYTHTHDDHFNYLLFWTRFVARKKLAKPLNVYLVDSAFDVIDDFYMKSKLTAGRESYSRPEDLNFVRLEFGKEYEIGNLRVTPLRGDHGTAYEKNAANFLIKLPNGKLMYYGLDSGYYLDETFDALAGSKLDLLISECTMPILTDDGKNSRGHLNLHTALRVFERLFGQGTIDENTQVWLTHIAPIGSTHAELCEYIGKLELPYKLDVGYDGLSLEADFGW